MKTFEEAWELTDKIPGSFTRLSAEKLYEFASYLPKNATIAEIGVDQGRSLSVMIQATEHLKPLFILVDAWHSVLHDNMIKVKKMLQEFEPQTDYMMFQSFSVEAAKLISSPLDLIHIDAHHFDDTDNGGPSLDCASWLPKVKSGGVACFHDYNSCFPDVNIAVDKYCAGWEDLGDWDGLAIRRKP